jgi:hypothetical protein
VACYSLILFNAESDLGAGSQLDDLVHTVGRPNIVFRANALGTMLTLVALGHGVGLVGSAQMAGVKRRDVVLRPIAGAITSLVTYVLHSSCGVPERLAEFIKLARELLNGDSTAELSGRPDGVPWPCSTPPTLADSASPNLCRLRRRYLRGPASARDLPKRAGPSR